MTTAAVEPRAGERAPLGALSTDHKAVAIRLGWLCGAFFLAGGVLALLVRSELAVPGMQIVARWYQYLDAKAIRGQERAA